MILASSRALSFREYSCLFVISQSSFTPQPFLSSSSSFHANDVVVHSCYDRYLFILPDSNFLNGWVLAILVLVIISSLTVPVEACFSDIVIFFPAYNNIVNVLFGIDLILNFFLAYDDGDGQHVFNFRASCSRYVFSVWFWVDLLSCIPIEMFSDALGGSDSDDSESASKLQLSSVAKAIKLLRMVRLGKVARRFDKHAKHGAQFLKLIGVVLLMIHWVACGWNWVGREWRCRYPEETTSISTFNETAMGFTFEELDSIPRGCDTKFIWTYSACLWQACRTLFGGDSDAFTLYERYYFCTIVVVGAIMQATVFGSMANLIREFDEDRRSFEQKLDLVRHKMEFLHVPVVLQDRVVCYYENLWQHHKSLGGTSATAFIGELSRPLQMELKLNLFKEMLTRIPFLQAVDTAVAEELVLRLDSHSFMKGDMVIRKSDPGDWMGFVARGMIAVLDPRRDEEDVIVRLLRVGAHLGGWDVSFCSCGRFDGRVTKYPCCCCIMVQAKLDSSSTSHARVLYDRFPGCMLKSSRQSTGGKSSVCIPNRWRSATTRFASTSLHQNTLSIVNSSKKSWRYELNDVVCYQATKKMFDGCLYGVWCL